MNSHLSRFPPVKIGNDKHTNFHSLFCTVCARGMYRGSWNKIPWFNIAEITVYIVYNILAYHVAGPKLPDDKKQNMSLQTSWPAVILCSTNQAQDVFNCRFLRPTLPDQLLDKTYNLHAPEELEYVLYKGTFFTVFLRSSLKWTQELGKCFLHGDCYFTRTSLPDNLKLILFWENIGIFNDFLISYFKELGKIICLFIKNIFS